MPTLNDITVTLQSQYDALAIPEFASKDALLNDASPTPTRQYYVSDGEDEARASAIEPILPTDKQSIDAYIPTYPSSQFWICYQCPGFQSDIVEGVGYYYFKFIVGDRCFLSWGSGAEDSWCGKTMFGLFDGGTDFEGRQMVERRGLFFAHDFYLAGDETFEIRVFRAKARRREKTSHEVFDENLNGGGLSIHNVGRVRRGEPQRLYTYALIDAVDEPYSTFRYHLCLAQSRSSTAASSPRSDEDCSPQKTISDVRDADMGRVRRLSVPPSMRLLPIGSEQIEGHAGMVAKYDPDNGPCKEVSLSSSTRLQERAATPPSFARRRDGSMGMLKGVIANALKRKDGNNRSTDSLAGCQLDKQSM
ncbi:hypothetical protein EJ03DRAFT_68719 [Teratosphaeria nubilosa]|uniref:Uncharacterized protein n=1 Tax=Teratosphaeria nubilosa TaxID=161662 RepID=A0A6G1LMC3_9PEZI|nr:hypothetical protein EJ03DRAFT_68719 [Teratosphaeria nubilosa]